MQNLDKTGNVLLTDKLQGRIGGSAREPYRRTYHIPCAPIGPTIRLYKNDVAAEGTIDECVREF